MEQCERKRWIAWQLQKLGFLGFLLKSGAQLECANSFTAPTIRLVGSALIVLSLGFGPKLNLFSTIAERRLLAAGQPSGVSEFEVVSQRASRARQAHPFLSQPVSGWSIKHFMSRLNNAIFKSCIVYHVPCIKLQPANQSGTIKRKQKKKKKLVPLCSFLYVPSTPAHYPLQHCAEGLQSIFTTRSLLLFHLHPLKRRHFF